MVRRKIYLHAMVESFIECPCLICDHIPTGWYFGLVMDSTLKIDGNESVERKRGEELRMHLVRSKSVALIKSGQALSLRPDLLRKKTWAEELGKLVDEVGSFPDIRAMNIMRDELSDLLPKIKHARLIESKKSKQKADRRGRKTRLTRLVESDPVLSLFEFYNDCRVVASASIGQVVSSRGNNNLNKLVCAAIFIFSFY